MTARALAVLVFATLLPASAQAYSVTLGAGNLGDAPSRFAPVPFPASSLNEKAVESGGSFSSGGSTFGLKQLDAATRTKTEKTLSALGARRDGEKIIVNLPSDVLFDFDKSDIRRDARTSLMQLSEVLKVLPDEPVKIVGHTDSKGSDAYNQALSERRAASVERWLAGAGVTSAMETEGKGETEPLAPNQHADGSDDAEGRQKNRRVEFIIGGQ